MRVPRILSEKDDYAPLEKQDSFDTDNVRADTEKSNGRLGQTGSDYDSAKAHSGSPKRRTEKKKTRPSNLQVATNGVSVRTHNKGKKGRNNNKSIVSIILTVLAIACFALGIYFLVLPNIVHKRQDDTAQKLLDKLKEQEALGLTGEVEITVRVGDVNAPGSFSPEYDVVLRPGETLDPNRPVVTEPDFNRDDVITIKTDTIMRIPKIDLEIAIAPDVKSSSLWVLPGHYPSSVQAGQKGVAAYFGHRMYGKGRHFNRLNEVEKGDTVDIQRKGKIYTYIVDAQRIINPTELGEYVFEKTSKAKIALVTCHPIQTVGVPKQRIVIQGHLTEVRDVK
ncbi:MAG TPA: sortase [Clostridiaceae bacterium]|nr:sortase [Clostridiaceae bacterium]